MMFQMLFETVYVSTNKFTYKHSFRVSWWCILINNAHRKLGESIRNRPAKWCLKQQIMSLVVDRGVTVSVV